MTTTRPFLVLTLLVVALTRAGGQTPAAGTVTGIVRADSTREPLVSVNVALLRASDSSIVTGTVSDARGAFRIERVPGGEYLLRLSLLGFRTARTRPFQIPEAGPPFDAGTIFLRERAVQVGEATVSADRPLLSAAIDRKVYDVGQDLASKSGSVSDLLQHIPSVQVDVDGTVSLRGSPSVQILINGKSSSLTANGDVLQDIPASSVERIEVITNPSAKFKPEGTAGLINIVLRNEADLGLNGSVGANMGNNSRYNLTASGNYDPGAFNLTGSYSFRQDERNTLALDRRTQTDSLSGAATYFDQNGRSFARPYTHFATLGVQVPASESDRLSFSGNLRVRRYTSTDTTTYLLRDGAGRITSDYDRRRIDHDQTPAGRATASYEHDFTKDDHTLRIEAAVHHSFDEEDNRFTNLYRTPAGLLTLDNRLIHEYEDERELSLDYHRKFAGGAVLEAGYDGTYRKNDLPYSGNFLDTATGALVEDPSLTNHFIYTGTIHGLYATYETRVGALGAMAGLRTEWASITSDLVTTGEVVQTAYWKIYPSLHLSWKLSEINELQLNYSLRVNRPDEGDLNPYPEAQNPRYLRGGNPRLQPEYIHSAELGWQFQNEALTVTPGIFYRNRYNGFTAVTRALNDSTLFSTLQNLSTDQSGGAELVVSGDVGKIVSVNASTNLFYEEIDATNLGYTGKKSATSWSGSLNCNVHAREGTMFQVNANYRSTRLTPQGRNLPGSVLNIGFRQELMKDKLSLTATLSDVFASQIRKTELDTPLLIQNAENSHDARVFYIGLTYRFGNKEEKSKEKSLQYDDNGG